MESSAQMWSEEELRRKVGQLFAVGFHSKEPDQHIQELITKHHVGAIIIFQRNIESADQLALLTNRLQDIARDGGHQHPLIIATDQENGLVTRIKPPWAAQMPGAMTLGATKSSATAVAVATATAETLSSCGINMNYGPVGDINSEPRNPVIGVRSPSDDPEAVGRAVSAQIQGLRAGGIVPCVKHFPGHGDTAVDSHYGLPEIEKSRSELEDCELVPFRRAVSEQVESIMTAHIRLPQLEGDGLPTSLNPEVHDILRKEMRYNGVIVSDCLEMDGVRATYGTERAALMALKAGTDSLMICHTFSVQVGAIELITQAVLSGELNQDVVQQAFERVTRLKEKHLKWETKSLKSQLRDEMNVRHTAIARAAYSKSTTLVRSESSVLPLSRAAKVVLVSPRNIARPSGAVDSGDDRPVVPNAPEGYADILRKYCSAVTELSLDGHDLLSTPDLRRIQDADVVILASRNAKLALDQKKLGYLLAQQAKKLIVVATCEPYDFLEDTDTIKTYLTIYEPTAAAFHAAVEAMFGLAEAQGQLPVGKIKQTPAIEPTAPEDILTVSKLWNRLLPQWRVDTKRLEDLMRRPNAKTFVVRESGKVIGFWLGYTNDGGLSKITCVLVEPAYQSKGIGTALIHHARRLFRNDPSTKVLSYGSVFPRFWPNVPLNLAAKDDAFLRHRGLLLRDEKTARDLFQDIRGYTAPPEVVRRAAEHCITFAPLAPDGGEECLAGQRRNFYRNQAWVRMYERLVGAGECDEIMVAYDAAGRQVGWTLMASPASLANKDFAFLSLASESGKTGLIACVGVDEAARKNGIGIAMLCKAIEDMTRRGLDAVVIDWVVIRGFYEKLGFKVWREYYPPMVW